MGADFYAIVNRAAGGGRAAQRAPDALAGLERRGLSLEVVFTKAPKHAIELAREAASQGQRRFLSVGGDGTASEVVNGLIGSGVARECQLEGTGEVVRKSNPIREGTTGIGVRFVRLAGEGEEQLESFVTRNAIPR